MTLLECIKLSPVHLCHCHGTISLFWRRRFQGVPPNFVSLAEALCHTRLGDLRYESVVPSHILTLICERFVSLRLIFRYLSFNEPYNAAKSRDFWRAARRTQKDEIATSRTNNHLVNCNNCDSGRNIASFTMHALICAKHETRRLSLRVKMSTSLSALVWCSGDNACVRYRHQIMTLVWCYL